MKDTSQPLKFTTSIHDGIPEISPEEVFRILPEVQAGRVRLIDVRRPEEFHGELGRVPESELATLGPDLDAVLKKADPTQPIVFICRSGARSAKATLDTRASGFRFTLNMTGGMLLWNELKLPVERSS